MKNWIISFNTISFAFIHLLFMLISSAILWGFDTQQKATSYFLGSLLIFLNMLVLAFAWKLILSKKFIALAVTIIVFKYAILGVIIYKLFQLNSFNALYFVFGVFSLTVSAVILALWPVLFGRKLGF